MHILPMVLEREILLFNIKIRSQAAHFHVFVLSFGKIWEFWAFTCYRMQLNEIPLPGGKWGMSSL